MNPVPAKRARPHTFAGAVPGKTTQPTSSLVVCHVFGPKTSGVVPEPVIFVEVVTVGSVVNERTPPCAGKTKIESAMAAEAATDTVGIFTERLDHKTPTGDIVIMA